MANKKDGAIVAIHGVGAPEPGAIVTELSTLFPEAQYTRDDIVILGYTYSRLREERGEHPDLLELNWSDVKRPPKSVYGVVDWTISLSLALARANLSWSGVQLLTGRVYAHFVEMILLWIIYPVLLGFMHANLHSEALATADIVLFGIVALTYWMVRRATKLAATVGAVTTILLPVMAVMLWRWPEWALFVNPIAVRAYGLAQIGAAVLITLTGLEVAIRAIGGEITAPGATARLALAYLPLVMLSALGSCVWAVSLNIVDRLSSDKIEPKWEDMFVRNLGYDLKLVEWATAGVTFALGCFVIIAVLKYRLTKPIERGQAAHRSIWRLTVFAPLCLSIPGALLALTSPYFGGVVPAEPKQDVLQVYTISALRILPWLVAAVPGIRALLDVLADVVFYVTDRELGLSSFKVCNDRLSLLLKYAEANYPWIHVVAHSQGSVIAHTTLCNVKSSVPMGLTTMGSPLKTLYAKYLNWRFARPPEDWRNLFRSGDYVGGPVGIPDVDEEIGVGGHTGYWGDVRIVESLKRDISKSADLI